MVPVFRVSNLDKKNENSESVGASYDNHSSCASNENNDNSILTWSKTLRNSKISSEDDYNA
jgi:hypothetical protein